MVIPSICGTERRNPNAEPDAVSITLLGPGVTAEAKPKTVSGKIISNMEIEILQRRAARKNLPVVHGSYSECTEVAPGFRSAGAVCLESPCKLGPTLTETATR